MKKRVIMALLVGVMTLTSAMPTYAASKQMADGSIFDAEFYATNNPDVVAALGTDENLLYNHYVNNGKNEGRKPYADVVTLPKFDAVYYATHNPDVVAVLGTDEAVLYNHYITCGKNEGRIPCENGTPFMEVAPLETTVQPQVPTTAEVQQPNGVKDSRLGKYVDRKRRITYSLPYIINGIDIRTGDWNGDGKNDNNGNTWYEGQTWTASNGYVLRIADQYYVQPGARNGNDAVFRDGTENLEPTGPFALAYSEYMGQLSRDTISPKDLPKVNTVSTKQTSINVNDPSFIAYKTAFDPLWKQQNGGNESELFAASNGIGLIDNTLGYHYLWAIKYNEDSGDWTFGVKGSYTELGWNAVKNSIRMITPDADAVFDTIYKACYYGVAGLECKKYEETNWITIGSTQLKTDWTSGTLYFRFK